MCAIVPGLLHDICALGYKILSFPSESINSPHTIIASLFIFCLSFSILLWFVLNNEYQIFPVFMFSNENTPCAELLISKTVHAITS